MSTTKNEVIRKKPGDAKKVAPVLVNKTLVTIHPDGVITVEKSEETVTEQVMSKSGAS